MDDNPPIDITRRSVGYWYFVDCVTRLYFAALELYTLDDFSWDRCRGGDYEVHHWTRFGGTTLFEDHEICIPIVAKPSYG